MDQTAPDAGRTDARAEMTFDAALLVARDLPSERDVLISRPRGPRFRLDEFGQLHLENDCLYLGDILDFADWSIEERA